MLHTIYRLISVFLGCSYTYLVVRAALYFASGNIFITICSSGDCGTVHIGSSKTYDCAASDKGLVTEASKSIVASLYYILGLVPEGAYGEVVEGIERNLRGGNFGNILLAGRLLR